MENNRKKRYLKPVLKQKKIELGVYGDYSFDKLSSSRNTQNGGSKFTPQALDLGE